MEIVTIIIAILFAIVLSNVLNHIFPRLPLTLIQIAFGCLLALTPLQTALELEPELFMIMVIAPLLYREAEESDLLSFWHVKSPVFFMAFLLVFITVFAVGFSVHFIIPAIPIAACFSLGAILGPTDVVAVSSLSARIKIDNNLMSVLLGEGLINDASGVIAFSFAVAALSTGSFSLLSAIGQLLIKSLGGFLIGYLLISLKRNVTKTLRKLSLENTATYVLIELLMPFLCYIVAELCHVSGVLAAVMAGIRQGFALKRTRLFEAELTSSTNTLWDVITFSLNSLVFLLLGFQLPSIVSHIWHDTAYSHRFLIITALLVTAILFIVRFLSVLFIARGVLGNSSREKIKSALVLTLSGVKGTVSLATSFALPFIYGNGTVFKERPLLLFITGGVIIISLALALVLLPLISDSTAEIDSDSPLRLELLEETLAQLLEQENNEQISMVIATYQWRIRELQHAIYGKTERRELRSLYVFAYFTEVSALNNRSHTQTIRPQTYFDYLDLISTMYHRNIYGMYFRTLSRFERLRWIIKRFLHPSGRTPRQVWLKAHRKTLQSLFSDNTNLMIRALNDSRDHFSEQLLDRFIDERIDLNSQVAEGIYGALHAHMPQSHDNALLQGYYVERRVIYQFLEQGKITATQANTFRVDVNKLESFTLEHNRSEIVLKFLALTGLQQN
ncbi:sodium:proton antiporter [Lachnospiraceae bacterium ZAX-1]